MTYLEQGTVEWKSWRRDKIGASDAAVILGISPYSTPMILWEEKLGLRPEKEINSAMARGSAMEDQARREYENVTGNLVIPEVRVHPDYPWMICSLDGISLGGDMIVEIKCPNKDVHEKARAGHVVPHYYAQIQHQLCVTGLQKCHYFTWNGVDGHLVVVDRNDEYIDKMIDAEIKFYGYMKSYTPPELLDRDYIDKTKDAVWCELEDEYALVNYKHQELTKERERLRQKMIEAASEHNIIGRRGKLTKKITKGRVDYESIECLKGIDLEPYRKASIASYVITIN